MELTIETKSPDIFLPKEDVRNIVKKVDKKKTKGQWEEFYQEFTMHGFREAFDVSNSSLFRRLFWRLLLLGMLGFTCFLFYGVLDQYLEYDFKVSKQIYFDLEKLDFPRVTICNMNTMSKKNLQRFNFQDEAGLIRFHRELKDGGLNTTSPKNKEILGRFYSHNLTTYHDILNVFELGKKDMLEGLNIIPGFLYKCKFEETECTSEDFSEIYTMEYGRCIVYPGYEEKQRKKVKRNGKGLRLLLNIHDDETMDSSSIFNGLVLFIHPQTETLNSVMSKKIFTEPGSLNTIHVTINKVRISLISIT